MTQFDDEAFDHVKWANEVEPRINTYIVKEEAIREGRFYGQK